MSKNTLIIFDAVFAAGMGFFFGVVVGVIITIYAVTTPIGR